MVVEKINRSLNVTASIYYFDNTTLHFNQELSPYALLVEIGTLKSSKDDIEECIDAFSTALGNLL
jgi:hypothetical protein